MLPEMEQPNGNPPKLNLHRSRRIVAFNFENSCPTKWATCQKNWMTLKLFLTWMRLFGDSFFVTAEKSPNKNCPTITLENGIVLLRLRNLGAAAGYRVDRNGLFRLGCQGFLVLDA